MGLRNEHWLNLNEGRPYPLDDSGTLISDQGVRMPYHVITDLNLRYPNIIGNYPFVSALTVTPTLVSVTIEVATSLDDVDGFAPLAVLGLPLAGIVVGQQIPLQSQYPGAGGWITLGNGIFDTPYSGRFSTPRQSLLAPRAARPYIPPAVASLGRLGNATTLTGLVRLVGTDPIEIVKETREIANVVRDCIVIRLTQSGPGTTIATAADDVFATFAGPCAGRPESNSCGSPAPIEFINAVPPDCNGTVTLQLAGCALASQLVDPPGIVVDCAMGLAVACPPPYLPDADGNLPTDVAAYSAEAPPPEPESQHPGSDSIVIVDHLPFITCWEGGDTGQFVNAWGQFVIIEERSLDPLRACPDVVGSESTSGEILYSVASEGGASASQRNVALWEFFDDAHEFPDDTIPYRKVTMGLILDPGPNGAKHNGGIVLAYVPDQFIQGNFDYFIAEIDYDDQVFRIQRFQSGAFTPVVSVPVLGLRLGRWYRIVTKALPGQFLGQVKVTATLDSGEDPLLDVTIGPVQLSPYPGTPSLNSGQYGIGCDRSYTRFSHFKVEEFLGP